MNKIFVKRSIEVLPKDAGWYYTMNPNSEIFPRMYWFRIPHGWDNSNQVKLAYWLEPITPEQFLSEHPEIVEKIFEAAREKRLNYYPDFLNPRLQLAYPTAQDYINSLKTQP